MADIFQEIDEEERQRKLEAFWKKWGNLILGGAVALVAAVAALQYWRATETAAAAKASAEFMAAAQLFSTPGSEDKAIAAFAKIADGGSSGYRLAARMNQAAAHVVKGETAKAVAIYDDVAASGIGGRMMADFARYRAALALADTAPQVDLQNRLEPVANGSGPWAPLARELMAYSIWRSGNLTDAQKRYDLLANDATAPNGLRQRAKNMLDLIALGIKPSGVAPTPGRAQTPDAGLDLLPETSLSVPEIPQ